MPTLLDLQKLKVHLGGIQSKLNYDTVEPFVKVAERDFRRTVGNELYDYLTGYTDSDPTTQELVQVAQGCVAWAAYDMALPHLKQRVGDLGMVKNSPANTTAITKWEYVDTREANMAMVDMFWEFFWELLSEVSPQAWKDSTAYQAYNALFIRSADELQKYLPLAGRNRRFFRSIAGYIQRAEQLYISDLLTEGTFDTLKDRWQNPAVTLEAVEKKLVEKIRHALAPLAIYEAYPYLPIKIDENGVREVRKWEGTTNESPAAMPLRQAQREQLWKDGQLYLARLRTFMNATATAEIFPEYYTANLTVDDLPEEDFSDKPHFIL